MFSWENDAHWLNEENPRVKECAYVDISLKIMYVYSLKTYNEKYQTPIKSEACKMKCHTTTT